MVDEPRYHSVQSAFTDCETSAQPMHLYDYVALICRLGMYVHT